MSETKEPILRAPVKPPRTWIFRETGEVRLARRGEWYCDDSAKVPMQAINGTITMVSIVRVVEQKTA